MTIEQIEKGRKLLDQLNVWKTRYVQWENCSLSRITMDRYSCADVCFNGAGNDLSIRFFKEVELKYGELCKKQIEQLEKELEAL